MGDLNLFNEKQDKPKKESAPKSAPSGKKRETVPRNLNPRRRQKLPNFSAGIER